MFSIRDCKVYQQSLGRLKGSKKQQLARPQDKATDDEDSDDDEATPRPCKEPLREVDAVPERRQCQDHGGLDCDQQPSRMDSVPERRQRQDRGALDGDLRPSRIDPVHEHHVSPNHGVLEPDQQASRMVQPGCEHPQRQGHGPFDNYAQWEYVRPAMGWGHDPYEDVPSQDQGRRLYRVLPTPPGSTYGSPPPIVGYPSAPGGYTYQPQQPEAHSRTGHSSAPLQVALDAELQSRPTMQYRGDLGRHSRINPQVILASTHDALPPSSRGLVPGKRTSQKPPNRIPPVGSSVRFENSFASSSKSHGNRSVGSSMQFENAFASSSKSQGNK